LLRIREAGFRLNNLSSAGPGLYGRGLYFAECSSKCDEYSKDLDHDGIYGLLLCRVVLGEVLQMTAGGEAAQKMISAAMESGLYDAVLGNREACVGTYREFVVYDERRVYPEFVVHYSRQYARE